jgi:hypothetical protein
VIERDPKARATANDAKGPATAIGPTVRATEIGAMGIAKTSSNA